MNGWVIFTMVQKETEVKQADSDRVLAFSVKLGIRGSYWLKRKFEAKTFTGPGFNRDVLEIANIVRQKRF